MPLNTTSSGKHRKTDGAVKAQSLDDGGRYQDLDGRSINPTKLVTLLRRTFDDGSYEVHMIHDIYSIRTPRELSRAELQACM
ncbi:hypothetical protein FDECE_3565 [Fusarium decemcellulare]|nr:hypothetical protein FDECE_3565 [Fusarium decemcellulare]